MTKTRESPRNLPPLALALLFLALIRGLMDPSSTLGAWQGAPARQVVMFAVHATPGGVAMDRKISPAIQAELRKALPNHSFKLVKVKSERVMAGQSMTADLGDGFGATAQLLNPLDPNGKVQVRFELSRFESSMFQTVVVTPPDQFNYFDKRLDDGSRLLLGIGAR